MFVRLSTVSLAIVVCVGAFGSNGEILLHRVEPSRELKGGHTARPSATRFSVGDWTVIPVVEFSTGRPVVDSLLALRNEDGVHGENIHAVWYQRGKDSTWDAMCWADSSNNEAVGAVKQSLGISSRFDMWWGEGLAPPRRPVADTSRPYRSAFEVGDPLGERLSNAPQRDEIVWMLYQVGYKVADLPFDAIGSERCGSEDWLGAMADSAEAAESHNSLMASGQWESPRGWNKEFLSLAVRCGLVAWAPPPSTATPYGPWTPATPTNFEVFGPANGACTYIRQVTWTTCRTVTVTPVNGPPLPPVTECYTYYCTETRTCPSTGPTCQPASGMRACGGGVDNTIPFVPTLPDQTAPYGPANPVPGAPAGVRPTTMPLCSGGFQPWP